MLLYGLSHSVGSQTTDPHPQRACFLAMRDAMIRRRHDSHSRKPPVHEREATCKQLIAQVVWGSPRIFLAVLFADDMVQLFQIPISSAWYLPRQETDMTPFCFNRFQNISPEPLSLV